MLEHHERTAVETLLDEEELLYKKGGENEFVFTCRKEGDLFVFDF